MHVVLSNYLLLLNSPVSLDFVGYTGLVSQDAVYPKFCFSNMFFESFHHHSRGTHMYIGCLAYRFSVVLPI